MIKFMKKGICTRPTIIAGIAIAMLAVLLTMMNNSKINKAAEQVPELAAAIRQKYQMRSDYRGLNTAEVLKLQAAPQSMITKNGLINALGHEVLAGKGPEGAPLMPMAREFDIIFKNLDKSECVGIATHQTGEKNQLGLKSIMIIHSQTEKTYSWGGENPLPISAEEAKSVCKQQNILVFSYE